MARIPRKPVDPAAVERLRALSHWMDSRWEVPGTGIRFGLDSVAGLVPGVGDTLTSAVSAYIVWQAREMGVPKRTLARMLVNIGVDWAVGTVPLVGDLFDLGFKANRKNMALLHRHLEEAARHAGPEIIPPGAAAPHRRAW
ncbi:MAG TPA: DUF4112 domain-containing protein [Azospirillaceae bacterium]|nr:DUF4112 domain-containing protein [Azospirillaceae bacterium]